MKGFTESIFSWPILPLILFLLLIQYGLRFVLNYKIGRAGIEFTFMGIPFNRISFGDIDEIRKISFEEVFHFISWRTMRMGNRLFGQGVLIRKKEGIITGFWISPDNADEFVQEVQKHLPI